jgi:HEPN domain-containing protein
MSASPDFLTEAQRWMRYAREELTLACVLASDADSPARLVCWHSQQAAEKALKAALIVNGTESPRTHNLVALRALLPSALARRMDIAELAELTQWGTESRYPGDWDEPSDEDAAEVFDVANRAVAVLEDVVSGAVRAHGLTAG